MSESRAGVSKGVMLAYALPSIAQALVGVPIFVYLPRFYTDVLGVSLTTLGTLFLVGRMFDAVSDPMVGAWSDRLRTRWGRRRPLIALGAVPLAVVGLCLYIPPTLSPTAATWWFGVFFLLTFLFSTIVYVPYKALGPELTHDYNGRTKLFAWRDSALMLGTLLAASGPALVTAAQGLGDGVEDQRMRFQTYALCAIPIMLLTAWWCARRVKEQPLPARVKTNIWHAIRQALDNKPFCILLAAYTIVAVGSNLPPVLLEYYASYVIKKPGFGPYVLGGYFLTGMLAMPFWVWISNRYGKKTAWIGAMLVTVCPFAPVYFLGEGDLVLYVVATMAAGFGGVAVIALPASLQADVIDYDELQTGQRREGLFISLWSIAEKAAYALGVGLALPLLDWMGYKPNVAQNAEVVHTLRVLYVVVPCACIVVAVLVGLTYPLSRERHEAVQAALRRKARGRTVTDPLNPGVQIEGG